LSAVFRVYSGANCTDLTNGFRAYRVALFDNPEFRIEQSWLNTYEFEYYVHWKVLQCTYRLVEVPVSKTYPAAKNVPYTKVRPFSGWWQMLRPFLFLWLRIKE
jgi:dolichol-phosphate mannosyltransferase